MPSSPVTQADRDRVRELHAQGMSRNDIARDIGRSGSTVTKIAKQLGLSFERGAEVAAATEAMRADAKARRAELVLLLVEDAHKLREQLWKECTIHNFGGRDNTHNSKVIDRPLFGDQRAILMSVNNAVNTALKIEEFDAGTGLPQAVSLLERIATGLTARHGTGDDEHPEPDTPDA